MLRLRIQYGKLTRHFVQNGAYVNCLGFYNTLGSEQAGFFTTDYMCLRPYIQNPWQNYSVQNGT